MATKKTVDFFRNLIFLECFLCINRSYLIDNKSLKVICNSIYFSVSVTVAFIVFYDVSYSDINFNLLAFQGLVSVELLGLTIFARTFTKQYIALQKLDEKFGLDQKYITSMRRKANVAAIATAASLIVDFCGMTLLSARPAVMIMFCLGAAAHDAELAFFSLFINVINIRLAKSVTVNPSFGSSLYRNLLIATSYFNEGFQFGILLMWLVTLLTTIIYGFVIAMVNTDKYNIMVCYIAWREFKSLYSLWVVCLASYQTEGIYKRLQFHLTSQVALESKMATEKLSKSQQTLYRWYSSVVSQQPRFTTGQNIAISLHIPIVMLDVSINYLLLVIQFYTAYK